MSMVRVLIRLGAYVPEHASTAPGVLESHSLPAHLRPDPATPVPNRAARRKARKR